MPYTTTVYVGTWNVKPKLSHSSHNHTHTHSSHIDDVLTNYRTQFKISRAKINESKNTWTRVVQSYVNVQLKISL